MNKMNFFFDNINYDISRLTLSKVELNDNVFNNKPLKLGDKINILNKEYEIIPVDIRRTIQTPWSTITETYTDLFKTKITEPSEIFNLIFTHRKGHDKKIALKVKKVNNKKVNITENNKKSNYYWMDISEPPTLLYHFTSEEKEKALLEGIKLYFKEVNNGEEVIVYFSQKNNEFEILANKLLKDLDNDMYYIGFFPLNWELIDSLNTLNTNIVDWDMFETDEEIDEFYNNLETEIESYQSLQNFEPAYFLGANNFIEVSTTLDKRPIVFGGIDFTNHKIIVNGVLNLRIDSEDNIASLKTSESIDMDNFKESLVFNGMVQEDINLPIYTEKFGWINVGSDITYDGEKFRIAAIHNYNNTGFPLTLGLYKYKLIRNKLKIDTSIKFLLVLNTSENKYSIQTMDSNIINEL